MSEGFLSIPIHLEKEDSLWVPTYSPKYDLLGILLYKTSFKESLPGGILSNDFPLCISKCSLSESCSELIQQREYSIYIFFGEANFR